MSARVVYHSATNDAATPWAVAEQLNAAPITQHETQDAAVTAAMSQAADDHGGSVVVHAQDGTIVKQLDVPDSALEHAGEHIERMDSALDVSSQLMPIALAAFGPATLNALITPQLQHSSTTIEVFVATLALASGVAISTYMFMSAASGRLAWGVAISGTPFFLFLASVGATLIHVGGYHDGVATEGGPIGVITFSVHQAIETWHPLGAALGFVSGVLVGRFVFRLVRNLARS